MRMAELLALRAGSLYPPGDNPGIQDPKAAGLSQ
jgi:hypothetical protein